MPLNIPPFVDVDQGAVKSESQAFLCLSFRCFNIIHLPLISFLLPVPRDGFIISKDGVSKRRK